jgi:putative tricarboxylic transport membrane protein
MKWRRWIVTACTWQQNIERGETMQRIHQITALIIMALSGFMMWESWDLEYYTPLGPGGGFFPFWIGAVMSGMALIWLIQISRPAGRPEEARFFPDRQGIVQVLSMIVAVTLTALLMDLLGFQLMMFLFLLFMLLVPGRQPVWLSLVFSIIGSVGVFHVFGRFLDVKLPSSALSLLAKIGL